MWRACQQTQVTASNSDPQRDMPKRDMLNVTQMLKHDYVQRKSRHKSNALDESWPK